MFDKTIKIDVDGATVYLTNAQVKELFTERGKIRREFDEAVQRSFLLAAERITIDTRLENANAKLKQYGDPGQF
tara:strand:+ start:135 stop:356 length:222 start_codon:yes stop_codon:yes gene_type:complete